MSKYMNPTYQVETGNIMISDALLKIAANNNWGNLPSIGQSLPWLVIFPSSHRGGFNLRPNPGYETVDILEFIKLLESEPAKPIIKIGEHEVTFYPDCIRVGCINIAKETVDEIYKRLAAKAGGE